MQIVRQQIVGKRRPAPRIATPKMREFASRYLHRKTRGPCSVLSLAILLAVGTYVKSWLPSEKCALTTIGVRDKEPSNGKRRKLLNQLVATTNLNCRPQSFRLGGQF